LHSATPVNVLVPLCRLCFHATTVSVHSYLSCMFPAVLRLIPRGIDSWVKNRSSFLRSSRLVIGAFPVVIDYFHVFPYCNTGQDDVIYTHCPFVAISLSIVLAAASWLFATC